MNSGKNPILGLAKVASSEDIPVLTHVLMESPYWDLRLYAAGALGSIHHPQAVAVLREAEKKKPFYVVRPGIQAALLRATPPGLP